MTEAEAVDLLPPTRRTQQQRRAETERRVLAATQQIILDHGAAAVTLAAVGEAAGYSRGIVNHAFGTRQTLIQTLAEQLQQRLATEVTGHGGDGLSRVLSWVDAYLLAFRHRTADARAFLMLWAQAATSEPDLRTMFAERDNAFRQAVAADIASGMADGSIRDSINPAATAVAIISQLRGTGIQLLLAGDPTPLDAVHRAVLDAVALSLHP